MAAGVNTVVQVAMMECSFSLYFAKCGPCHEFEESFVHSLASIRTRIRFEAIEKVARAFFQTTCNQKLNSQSGFQFQGTTEQLACLCDSAERLDRVNSNVQKTKRTCFDLVVNLTTDREGVCVCSAVLDDQNNATGRRGRERLRKRERLAFFDCSLLVFSLFFPNSFLVPCVFLARSFTGCCVCSGS